MIVEKRLDLIMDALLREKKVSNKYLKDLLKTSDSTLRRDLDLLEDAGKIKRVHGGAILDIRADERSFYDNEKTKLREKKLIGKKAASLIKDKSLVYIDAGSTTSELIDFIEARQIRIVTNGLMHINKLVAKGLDTIILGGKLKAKTMATTGLVAINELENFSFDLAFVGANGYDDDYFYTADINEALIKRKVIELSDKAFVLADRSKAHNFYHAKICRSDEAILIGEDE